MPGAWTKGARPIATLLLLASCAMAPLLAPARATATQTDLYVDKTMSACTDSGPASPDVPLCTIVKGVSLLQPGSTLYIGDGTYAETIKPSVSGTASAPVTVTAWPGKDPTIGTGVSYGAYVSSKSYVVLSDLTFAQTVNDGVYLSGSNHLTVSGCTVRNAGQPRSGATAPGLSVRSTSSSQILGNTLDHNSSHGIYVAGTSTSNLIADNTSTWNAEGWRRNANGIDVIAPGNTILRNVTHDNEDTGINFYTGGNNNLAALNVTYDNGDHGIDDYNVTGGRLIGNTVYHNCTSGINVEGTSGSYVVEDNVAVDNAVYPAYNGISCSRRTGNIGIWDSAPSSTTVDHNLVWLSKPGNMYTFGSAYSSLAAMQAATGQEADGVQGDPRFVAAGSGNLQLLDGSPAIDRGDSGVSGAQDHDILGNARVRDPSADNSYATGPRLFDDLGAYEFQPSGSTPAAPTARLTVSPTSGTTPLNVTADATASTDPQGQALTYTFDFGDGSTLGPQADATATHTYGTAGTYTLQVTVTDTSGLTGTATRTVTTADTPPPPAAPTARLTVSPTSGTTPLNVTADATASTDPQGQALTYTFDFGDGTTLGPQADATATHTYGTAGTYTLQVTVTDTSGLTGTTTQDVNATTGTATPPKLVSSIANNYATSTKTAGSITVWRSAGVRAGDLVVLTLQLNGTAATGAVHATDPSGTTYTSAADVADSAGNRLLLLSGVAAGPLAVNDKISVTFPSAAGYRMGGEEFSGATRLDQASTATGGGTSFSSGTAQATAGNEVAFGAVSVPAGTANPTWTSGWTDLGSYAVGSRYLGRAYDLPAPGGDAATGTVTGAWLAAVATFGP
ncbi:MAG TPA: PKD domain-containing protein [Nocardioidaceae bacterium]|nr:PKD domain-containing protein [Nocardioidaceae bacterium]